MFTLAFAIAVSVSPALTRRHAIQERTDYCAAAVAGHDRGFIPYCAPESLGMLKLEMFAGEQDALLSESERVFLDTVATDIDVRSKGATDAGCYGTNYRDCMAALSRSFTLLSSYNWPIPETRQPQFDNMYSAGFTLGRDKPPANADILDVPDLKVVLFTTRAMVVDSMQIEIQWHQGQASIDSMMAAGTATLLKAALPSCRPLSDLALAQQIKAATNLLWMQHLDNEGEMSSDRGVGRLCGKFAFVNLHHWENEGIQFVFGTRTSDTIQRRAGLGGLPRQPLDK